MSYPPQSGGPGDVEAAKEERGEVFHLNARLLRTENERDAAREQLRIVTAERDKFSSALDVMHAKLLRTENERDTAVKEVVRLRDLIDGLVSALEMYRYAADYVPLVRAAQRVVDEVRP